MVCKMHQKMHILRSTSPGEKWDLNLLEYYEAGESVIDFKMSSILGGSVFRVMV